MARKLYDEKQTPVATICQMLKISRPTFYRYIQTGAMPEVPSHEPLVSLPATTNTAAARGEAGQHRPRAGQFAVQEGGVSGLRQPAAAWGVARRLPPQETKERQTLKTVAQLWRPRDAT